MKRNLILCFLIQVKLLLHAYDFNVDGICYNILDENDKTAEVTCFIGGIPYYTGDIVIPETVSYNNETYDVTSIGWYAFMDSSPTSVRIPNSVTTIKGQAFFMSGITKISIPKSVISIGQHAFTQSKLQSLTIEDGDDELEFESSSSGLDYSFEGVDLKTIYIGRNISYPSLSPFYRNTMEKVTIGNKVTKISDGMFFGCKKIKEIKIPNSITWIGLSAFSESRLKTLVFEDGNKDLFITASKNNYIRTPFNLCTIDSLYLGRNVLAEAGYRTYDIFLGATINSIFIGWGVTIIPNGLFLYCSDINKLYLTNNIVDTGYDSFSCLRIKDIYCYSTRVIPVNSRTFFDLNVSAPTLHVPFSAIDKYKKNSIWGTFENIIPIEYKIKGDCTDINYWSTFIDKHFNYIADKNTTAFSATLNEVNGFLNLTPIEDKIIKANQGVVLRSTTEDISLLYTEEMPTESYFSENVLMGSNNQISTSDIKGTIYVLEDGSNGVGFYKYLGNYLKEHRAYYLWDFSSSAPEFIMYNIEESTNVKGITTNNRVQTDMIFDICGRLTTSPQKGIYLIKGKKTLKVD